MSANGILSTLLVGGLGIYLGGALTMELVWRPVQRDIASASTRVLCQRMGRRYRFLAAAALAGAAGGASGLVAIGRARQGGGVAIVLLAAGWLALAGILGTLTWHAHPSLHVRVHDGAPVPDRAEANARLLAAVRRMNVLLRVDLGVALALSLVGAWIAGVPT